MVSLGSLKISLPPFARVLICFIAGALSLVLRARRLLGAYRIPWRPGFSSHLLPTFSDGLGFCFSRKGQWLTEDSRSYSLTLMRVLSALVRTSGPTVFAKRVGYFSRLDRRQGSDPRHRGRNRTPAVPRTSSGSAAAAPTGREE